MEFSGDPRDGLTVTAQGAPGAGRRPHKHADAASLVLMAAIDEVLRLAGIGSDDQRRGRAANPIESPLPLASD
jgi:hypothetical protein